MRSWLRSADKGCGSCPPGPPFSLRGLSVFTEIWFDRSGCANRVHHGCCLAVADVVAAIAKSGTILRLPDPPSFGWVGSPVSSALTVDSLPEGLGAKRYSGIRA